MAKAKSIQQLNPEQPVFVGLDVHKNKWSVSILHCDEEIGHFTIPGEFSALKKILDRFEGIEVHSVYEAGCLGFHLHYSLCDMDIKNIVVGPNKIPIKSGDLVKTDRRDSRKLAHSLSKGLLVGIHVPTPEDINARQIIRTREQFKRKRTRAINQIKMLLLQFDLKISRGLTNEQRKWLMNLELPEYIKVSVEMLLEEIEFVETRIKRLNSLAHKECQEERFIQAYKVLQTAPGIGQITAASLCFEVGGDWKRFSNAKKLCAFFGITPREFSSGEHVYRGRITGQGKSWLRSYLIEVSWKTICQDPAMRTYYNRIKMNSGSGKKAIVAVARKLLHRLFSMIKNNQCYEMGLVG
jgi:transposase